MKVKKIAKLSVFLLFGGFSLGFAEAPNILTYQGRLEEAGRPADGARTVQIRLCADPGGASCFNTIPETQGASVSNGLFRSTFTLPASLNLATGVWYLELAVNGNTYLPREQLTSTPYAVYSSSASALTASPNTPGVILSTSMFVTSGGIGIGTTSPVAQLDVVGTSKLARSIVQANDAGIALTTADFGKTFTVNSAAGQTITLPAVSSGHIGANLTVVKLGAGQVTIQAAAGTYIADSTSGGSIYNNSADETYATITLRLVTGTKWVILGGDGSWTTN